MNSRGRGLTGRLMDSLSGAQAGRCVGDRDANGAIIKMEMTLMSMSFEPITVAAGTGVIFGHL